MSIDTRRRAVRGFLMASAAVLVLAGPALAQEARHSFNIPAGDAVNALQAFAKQSGKQVLFPFEAASGKRTPAVTGDVADADALARLAKAAGLVVASDDGKTITLRQAPADFPQSQSVGAGASTDEAQIVEAVIVVGSQIEGARTTEALPVTVVGENEIIATGAVSGDELFRSIPQAGDVQFQEARTTGNLNDARGDVASLNLRSLGTGNTLALLNGRRAVLAPQAVAQHFYANMSERATAMLRDDIDIMGPMRLKEIDAAQQAIVELARRLADEGEIFLSTTDDGELVY